MAVAHRTVTIKPAPQPADGRRWLIEEAHRNIHRLRVRLEHVGDEQWVLLQSDVHWDNPACQRELLAEHLTTARERDAPIIDIGDFFCAMQGKWDKRARKDDLRPEHQRGDYLDALVETATAYLLPYKDLLTVRGQGNHETGVMKRHETDLTQRLVERLKVAGSSTIHLGGYSGFVVFLVQYAVNRFVSIKLHYHHGYGGGGPVTRGVIQTNRQAVYLADADIVYTGHTHDEYLVPIARIRLNQQATKIEHTRQVHLRTPGYKEEYGDGYRGWHIERGGPPKPVGAAWLRIRYAANDRGIEWDVFRA